MPSPLPWLFSAALFASLDLFGIESEKTAPVEKPPEIREGISPSAEPLPAEPRRWPVQILSAIYGTSGKDADVTDAVRKHVETLHHKFAVNPVDLGVDPNPRWNKSLRVVFMKDGVRRELQRGENAEILPETFYGPQDAAELRAWLPGTRWFGERPDVQFNADQTFTSPGLPGVHRWEALTANKLRLTWAGDRQVECHFDLTWTGFSELENARNAFHLAK